MNQDRFEKARDLVVSLQDIQSKLYKVASPLEVGLIRDLLDYESRDTLSDDARDRMETIRAYLREEDTYKNKPAKPVGDIQPLPSPGVEAHNEIAKKWAEEAVKSLDIIASGLPKEIKSIKIVDGYGPMLERTAAAEAFKKAKEDAIAKALAKLTRPAWYKRLWAWITRRG
jgi:beta-glucosidase-like glycosyl hydrolase